MRSKMPWLRGNAFKYLGFNQLKGDIPRLDRELAMANSILKKATEVTESKTRYTFLYIFAFLFGSGSLALCLMLSFSESGFLGSGMLSVAAGFGVVQSIYIFVSLTTSPESTSSESRSPEWVEFVPASVFALATFGSVSGFISTLLSANIGLLTTGMGFAALLAVFSFVVLLTKRRRIRNSDLVEFLSPEMVDFLYAVYIKDATKLAPDSPRVALLDFLLAMRLKFNEKVSDELSNRVKFECTRTALAGGKVVLSDELLESYFKSKLASVVSEYERVVQNVRTSSDASELIKIADGEFNSLKPSPANSSLKVN